VSFADRIRASRNFEQNRFVPFRVEGSGCGWMSARFAQHLLRWPEVFMVSADAVTLSGSLTSPESRSAAIAPVILSLYEQKLFSGWRDELYPVATDFNSAPLLAVERAAAPFFGIRTRGAHLTGYVGAGEDCHMWIARRSANKPVEPLMLDNLVGGGMGVGFLPRQTILKECDEEAGIPLEFAERAQQKSALLTLYEMPNGVHWEMLYAFDLELGPDFKPENRDGEVAGFQLLPIREIRRLVSNTTEFTSDAALVILDFLLRHDLTGADLAECAALKASLYGTISQ
jgi:8-oxo-dGTP pyrophosphatase MutT (NUDIX family)